MARHELGDLEQIKNRLELWLAERLALTDKLRLDDLTFPQESGESSVTLLLNAHFAGSSKRFVCRMQPVSSQVFDSHDLALQYRLMEIAAQEGVPTPGLLGYEADPTLLGSDFYIMEFIDGQIPADNPPYAFGSWVTELSDQERAGMWRHGIAAMAKVHQIDLDHYDLPTLPRARPGESPMQHEIDKFATLATPELRSRMDQGLLEALDYCRDNAPAECPRRLCWGDSRPGNVIWQQQRPAALIDWEMANLGDPLADVSWWYWIDHVNSVGLGVERLGGLPDRAAIYRQWRDITGLPTDESSYYDLFSVVRYAIVLERKFDSMEAAGMGRIPNFCLPFVHRQLETCQRRN